MQKKPKCGRKQIREEEQKEDIQEFNTTMKTFNVDQEEVDKFKASFRYDIDWLSRSESSAICDHADKFLHVLLMFKNKPGSERWYHTLDQLRKWETLPAKVRN